MSPARFVAIGVILGTARMFALRVAISARTMILKAANAASVIVADGKKGLNLYERFRETTDDIMG